MLILSHTFFYKYQANIVMIYGYIRVSSDKQTVENQRFEINNFCKKETCKSMIGLRKP